MGLINAIDNFKDITIAVIGDVMLDRYVWGSVNRISPEAPVPVVSVNKKDSYVLGGAANVANNIKTLGGNVLLYGVIGLDDNAKHLCDIFNTQGIPTHTLLAELERPTTVKTRVIGNDQQIVRIDREDVADIKSDTGEALFEKLIRNIKNVDIIIVSDYGKGVVIKSLMDKLVELKSGYDVKIIVDPYTKHYSYYNGVDILTPNTKEASAFYTIENKDDNEEVEKCGKNFIKELSCDAVLITRGKNGMSFVEKENDTIHLPTAAKNVFDVSGAGDTVISTFTLGVAAGLSTKDAMYIANVAAGIVVGEVGTAVVHPTTLKEILIGGLNG